MLIYCVEDDESIRDLVGYALRGQGYGMEGFSCADDFYKGMKKAVPDLVLLDVMLPGEDGLSILKKIREREANIPIIMMTAKSSEFDVVRNTPLSASFLQNKRLLPIIFYFSRSPRRYPTPRMVRIAAPSPPSFCRRLMICISIVRLSISKGMSHTACIICSLERTIPLFRSR